MRSGCEVRLVLTQSVREGATAVRWLWLWTGIELGARSKSSMMQRRRLASARLHLRLRSGGAAENLTNAREALPRANFMFSSFYTVQQRCSYKDELVKLYIVVQSCPSLIHKPRLVPYRTFRKLTCASALKPPPFDVCSVLKSITMPSDVAALLPLACVLERSTALQAFCRSSVTLTTAMRTSQSFLICHRGPF